MKKGIVYIAGAGPGDPNLISVKALNKLKTSDCILYDRLANYLLLSYCREDAEKIFAGKEPGHHHKSQEEIIELMKIKANEGKTVLRLKGGDSLIFGRGSEEALALKDAGIEYEIIPGISAGMGATAYAGIPLTHRKLVTQCVFLTAHEAPGKEETQINWEYLAKMANTNLVIYMGAAMIEKISNFLIDYGMIPDMPAAVVENGTLPNQRSLVSNIKDIPEKAKQQNFSSPLIFLIGPTVPLRDSIMWRELKPLAGKRIITTRAIDQSESLFTRLLDEYAAPIVFQSIKTSRINPYVDMKSFFNNNQFDWLFFTSENGVRHFFDILKDNKLDTRALGGTKIAAIGSGTALKLNEFNIFPDFVPKKFTSASLLEEMPLSFALKSKKILRVKGDFDRDQLSDGLKQLGAKLTTLNVYKIQKDNPPQDTIDDIIKNGADCCMFTSVSTVNNFFDTMGDFAEKLLNSGKTIPLSIGPVTSQCLKEKGIKNILETDTHTIDGMIEKMKSYFTGEIDFKLD